MTIRRALFFDIRKGEGRAVAFAFLALLGVTAAHTLIETARDALFLARIPAAHLPALYLVIAAIGVVTTRASTWFGSRKANESAIPTTKKQTKLDPVVVSMITAAAITIAFWIATAGPQVSPNVLYALYIFSGMFAGWVAGQLWLRFGALFTVVQAKRLYGAIGTGAVLGAVLGSALARAALAIIEVRHLLIAAAGILVATAFGATLLPTPIAKAQSRAMLEREEDDAEPSSLANEVKAVTRHPYLNRLLLLTLFAASAGTAIDFLFKREIAQSYSAAELGPLIATVSLATNAASLVAQAIGVGVIVRWLGVHRALYVMPFLIAVGAAGSITFGGVAAVLLLRGVDGAFRYSLHKTSTELLFVPLPDSLRSRAKPIIDLLGQRGGQAMISVAILGVTTFVAKKHVGPAVAVAILLLGLSWLVLAYTIRPRYLDVFRDTLRRGRVELTRSDDLPELDMGALEALIVALSSRRDAEVLGALDLLAVQRRGRLIPSLILYHPSKPIVLRALELLVRDGRADFGDIADRLTLDHGDPEVRTAALRARVAVVPDPDLLRERLTSPHEEVRATALIALVVTGAMPHEESQKAFTSIAESDDVHARRALAIAIGNAQGEAFVDRELIENVVVKLASDPDGDTRKYAASAMSAIGNPSFGPRLIEQLSDHAVGLAAVEALGVMGDATVKLLDSTLDRDDVTPEVKWRLAAALARSTSPDAVRILVRRVRETDDTALRSRMLRALRAKQSAGMTIPIAQADLVTLATNTIRAVARALAFRLAHRALLRERPELANLAGTKLLQRLLRDKEIEGVDRLFLVLSLLYPNERFPRIARGLESSDVKARASARELLENVVTAPLRDVVIAVVDDLSDDVRLARIGEREKSERSETTYEALVEAMIAHGSELAAMAIFHAGEIGMQRPSTMVDAAIGQMDASSAALARELSVNDLGSEATA